MKPDAIKKVFSGAIGQMANQAWLVGHLDAAVMLIDAVLTEAKANLEKHPKDVDCKDAVKRLASAKSDIEAVSKRLSEIAVGEK